MSLSTSRTFVFICRPRVVHTTRVVLTRQWLENKVITVYAHIVTHCLLCKHESYAMPCLRVHRKNIVFVPERATTRRKLSFLQHHLHTVVLKNALCLVFKASKKLKNQLNRNCLLFLTQYT